jgi:hypothetical protein
MSTVPPWQDAQTLCYAASNIYVNGNDFTTLTNRERQTVCELAVYACVHHPMRDMFEVKLLAEAIRRCQGDSAWANDLSTKQHSTAVFCEGSPRTSASCRTRVCAGFRRMS